jgi:hypothetical protein
MRPRRDSGRGVRIAGTLLLTTAMLDVVLGAGFGALHAGLGLAGMALLVPTMLGKEA